MWTILARRVGYSRAEYLSDLVVHAIGLLLVSAAVPVLIVLAALLNESNAPLIGTAIYGSTLFAVIAFSAVYNIFPHPEWEWLLKRLDHAAIFLKIAGTYHALALIAGTGTEIAPAIWAVAFLGVALKLVSPFRFRWIALSLYVGLGLLVGFYSERAMGALPELTFTLIAAAGVVYLIGVCFYLWDTLVYHFTIWHVLVLKGSMLVYAALVVAVVSP